MRSGIDSLMDLDPFLPVSKICIPVLHVDATLKVHK